MNLACLPWYALPELRTAQDELWQVVARHFRAHGVGGVPERLTHEPPIPAILTDPDLLIGQCCGYDVVYGFAGSVEMIATPRHPAPGCDGTNYRSFVLVRVDCRAGSLEELRGRVCVVNSFNYHSGTNALRALVGPLSRDGRFFSKVRVSGGHVDSLALLQAGEADVMAMDCVVHALLARHRPDALSGIKELGRNGVVPAPPFVTAAGTDRELAAKLFRALRDALSDEASEAARTAMLLDGVEVLPLTDYAAIIDVEAAALRHGYMELHATSPAIAS